MPQQRKKHNGTKPNKWKNKKRKHYATQPKKKNKSQHNPKRKDNHNRKRKLKRDTLKEDKISSSTMRDPRFQKVFTDPRFESIVEKKKDPNKVQVDSRFASMFTDPAFRTGYRIDRYGRQINNNEAYDLHKFYSIEDNNENQNEGYEAEKEEDDENNNNQQTALSKQMQKKVKEFKAAQNEEITEDDAFWNEWDKNEEDAAKPLTHKEEKLLHRKAGRMFDYDMDSTTSSSSQSDYNYDTLAADEVGDDARAVLDDNRSNISECAPTRRLAVVNCDWDNIAARDLYMIFRSFLPPESSIVSVSIHLSDYGAKMIAKEKEFGPDTEIWKTNTLPIEVKQMEKEAKFIDDNEEYEEMERQNEDEDDDEDEDEEEDEYVSSDADETTHKLHEEMDRLEQLQDTIQAIKDGRAGDVLEDEVDTVYNKQALRKYELQKLRYYYAIAELDSVETADRIYQELNNREYRQTCNVLSLSFVNDDFVPPHEAKDVCTDIPANYMAASDKQTNALGSTFLELSWDKTDPNRKELCQRAFTEHQLNNMDLTAYLQDDDAITDAGFDTDYPVTEYDTDTPDKKVLIKRRARNRYNEILNEFKELEKTVKGSDDDDIASDDTDKTDNDFGINVTVNTDKGMKALQDRLKQKQLKAMQHTKEAQLNIAQLSSTSEEDDEEEEVGDKEESFFIDDEMSNLNQWIDTQKRLKQTIHQSQIDNELEVNPKKRRRDEEEENDDDDEPLLVDGDMDVNELNDSYFNSVHDDSYKMNNRAPPKKKQKVNYDGDAKEKQKQMEQRAMLQMMLASKDGTAGNYDPENNEMDARELSKTLSKRMKRHWKLKWLIKKAVKKKLAQQDDFKFDAEDQRFSAVTEDPDFAMDPSDTSFRNTKHMKELLARTRKKRLNKWNKKGRDKLLTNKNNKESASSIDHLAVIQSLKVKSAKIPKLLDTQTHRKNITQKLKQKGLSSFQS